MKDVRMIPMVRVPAGHGLHHAPAPNDTASRALNEMRAVGQPIPPKPDPKDATIAELQRQSPTYSAKTPNATRNSSGCVHPRRRGGSG